MRMPRPAAVAALTTTLLGAGLGLAGAPSVAGAPTITCQGRPATVVGSTGTEGDDVMVVLPVRGVTAQALGGNDTICIVAAPEGGIRSVVVDAGPGDDTVVNASADVDDIWYTTILGGGADSYDGLDAGIPDNPKASPFEETVYAGTRDLSRSGLEGSQDTEADTIDSRGGDDVVYSGSPAPSATTNDDAITTGAGDDRVEWAGEQGSGTLDLGTGENALTLHAGWKGAAAAVDAPSRTATADGRTVLRWAGEVVTYHLWLDNRSQSFTGSGADETLFLAPLPDQTGSATARRERTISMGGGDDTLALYSMGAGSVDGGPGRDRWTGSSCASAVIRLGGAFSCVTTGSPSVSHDFDLSGFEDLLVTGGDVTVRGSDRAEKIKVVAARVRLRGRGGADVLNVNTSYSTVRYDRPVVMSGGAGDDRVVGSTAADVLRGGAGDDTLFGDSRNDTILGGPGHDKAFGQQGRDVCAAEARRSCERR